MKTSYSRQLLASGRVTCVAVSALHTMSNCAVQLLEGLHTEGSG